MVVDMENKRPFWNGILVAIPILVSLGALYCTWLQSNDTHKLVMLSMKPSVDFDTEDDPDDPPVGIKIENGGPGPAIIKSVIYYVDRKPVGDVTKMVEVEKLNGDETQYFSFDEGDTLAVGGAHWLISHRKRGKEDQAELNRFIDCIDNHVAIEVEFCPALDGQCYKKCSTKGWCE